MFGWCWNSWVAWESVAWRLITDWRDAGERPRRPGKPSGWAPDFGQLSLSNHPYTLFVWNCPSSYAVVGIQIWFPCKFIISIKIVRTATLGSPFWADEPNRKAIE